MEHLEIERKFLWTLPLPSQAPNRKVTRYLFPIEHGIERRVQKTVFETGAIEYRDQIKQELENGERKEIKKEIISEGEFNSLLSSNSLISKIERHEYDMQNKTEGIARVTLNYYPTINLSRLEIEFIDHESSMKYNPKHNFVEINGPLLRDATLSRLTKEEVRQEIDSLLTHNQ